MPKQPLFFSVLVLSALLVTAGCTISQNEVRAPVFSASPSGIVYAVDGAGGFHSTSAALRNTINEEAIPLEVEAVDWSHGHGRILADEMDCAHAHAEGERLAGKITALRQVHPDWPIYLVGHSAGSAVVLAAAESLPQGSVDRIILLSPSVSADYDLRPALSCTRDSVEVFYSSHDRGYLGLGVALFGTADGHWFSSAAGRVGFRPVVEKPEDAALYTKLRQHAWDTCVEWTGNTGGHYGGYQPEFLRAYLLPLLTPRKDVMDRTPEKPPLKSRSGQTCGLTRIVSN